MPQYSLSPGYIKMRYSVTISSIAFTHVMTLPIVNESPSWATLNVLQGNGTGVLWSTGLTTLVNLLKALWANTATFVDATLYRLDTPTSAPVVMATTTLNIVGTNAGANGQARGDLYYFTSTGGHPFRLLCLENNYGPNLTQPYASLDAAQKAVVDNIRGTTGIVRARDGLPIVGFQREVTKIYDKVRDKRLGL